MALTHSPAIITEGLVLHLDAGNPRSYPRSGTTWRDLSRRGNDGTLTNAPTFSSANGGNIVFDGSNDYVSTNFIYDLTSSSTEFTCGCWFKCGSQPSNTLLISNYNGTPNPFNLYVNQDGTLLGFTRNSSGTSVSLNTTNTYSDSKYHNVFYVKDLNNNYYIYADGVLQNSTNNNLGAINAGTTIWIGTLRLFNQGYFNGSIGQVFIYSKALKPLEIQQNFNATRARYNV